MTTCHVQALNKSSNTDYLRPSSVDVTATVECQNTKPTPNFQKPAPKRPKTCKSARKLGDTARATCHHLTRCRKYHTGFQFSK